MGPARLTGLVDSVVLIEHLNGLEAATSWLAARPGELAVSAVTRAEVLTGCEEAEMPRVGALLDRFALLPLDAAAADLAARLRRRHRWRLPDAFQAALAQLHGLRLVTRNTRDFPPSRHPFVLVPY